MGIEWGREIPVDGKRPAWLRDDDKFQWVAPGFGWAMWDTGLNYVRAEGWTHADSTTAIKLPADHFAYKALDAGFEPWGGGDSAPEDWDRHDTVLRRDGVILEGRWANEWRHRLGSTDIIGYRKRAAQVEGDPAKLAAQRLAAFPDFVAVRRMTEVEARRLFPWSAMVGLHALGLIREETLAERFARETGHEVTPAVEAALNWREAA